MDEAVSSSANGVVVLPTVTPAMKTSSGTPLGTITVTTSIVALGPSSRLVWGVAVVDVTFSAVVVMVVVVLLIVVAAVAEADVVEVAAVDEVEEDDVGVVVVVVVVTFGVGVRRAVRVGL